MKENLNQINELIIVLKASDNAQYGVIIEILDELNLAEAGIMDEIVSKRGDSNFQRKRKFTISEFTEDDREKIAEFNPQTGGDQ
jgi:hypothetical protein